jgi:hypothetical protein
LPASPKLTLRVNLAEVKVPVATNTADVALNVAAAVVVDVVVAAVVLVVL